MCTDTWIESYSIDDGLGIESLHLGICIQLVEIAYTKGEIGIGEEFHCLGFLHAHKKCIDIFLNGTFLQKGCKRLGCFLHLLDIGNAQDSFVFLSKLRAVEYLGIAYDNSTWIEIVVECLAFTKELWREKEIELLDSLLGILQV